MPTDARPTAARRPWPMGQVEPDERLTSDDLGELTWGRQQCRNGAAKAIRAAAGVSIPEVARVTGAAHSTVWRWENGQRVPHGVIGVAYSRLLRRLRKEVGW